MIGTIIKNISNDYTVISQNQLYICKPCGKLRNQKKIPLVGDQVTFDQENNYKIITMLTGIDNPSLTAGTHDYTFSYVIENIFGAPESPTAGKFYYISDAQIEKTIKDDIYSDLLPTEQSITDIKINDYFLY